MKAVWKGLLEVGHLSFEVGLYKATEDGKSEYKLAHDCLTPIEMPRYCPSCCKFVNYEDCVKVTPLPKGGFQIVKEKPRAATSSDIHVYGFTGAMLDPRYYDSTYYLEPADDIAVQAYAALVQALGETHRFAIGEVTMFGKARQVTITTVENVLVLNTIRPVEEVRGISGLDLGDARIGKAAVKAMTALVGEMELLDGDFWRPVVAPETVKAARARQARVVLKQVRKRTEEVRAEREKEA